MAPENAEEIIGKVSVGTRGETIQVRRSVFKGKAYVSVRKWYVEDGEEKPGKGISIPADKAQEVEALFSVAVRME